VPLSIAGARSTPWLLLGAIAAGALTGPRASAQGGPPYLTNDPGTPGNGNWEINLAAMYTREPGLSSWQAPQLDINYGAGERVQLTVEVPYLLQYPDGGSRQGGWSNASVGAKWRFFDPGDGGWQLATFPQIETAGSAAAQARGIAVDGPRLLLPVEVAKRLGPLDVNIEAGYYLPRHGPRERTLGLVVGRALTPRLEVDAEIFSDRAYGASPDDTTMDLGLRYQLHPAFVLLFMAGRSIAGDSAGHAQFMSYLGIQVLLSHYGSALRADPAP
jgi:hypothetical protein